MKTNHIARIFRLVAVLPMMLLLVPAMSAERLTYIHTDALGSPIAATDSSGNLLWREKYLPYGETTLNQSRSTSLWYTGHVRDIETALLYTGARYYDPMIGRFMGVDPAPFDEENPHSFNRYAYACNNPYTYSDPDGRHPILRIAQAVQMAWGRVQVAAGQVMSSPIGQLAMDFAYAETGTVAPRGGVVLGHYSDKLHSPNYIDLARATGARAFQIEEGIWNAMTPQQRLEANLRFLDQAVAQGWEIKLSGPLESVTSTYARELRYLAEKYGLVPNASWTKMIEASKFVPD